MIRLNDEFIPPDDDAPPSGEIGALTRLLQQGRPAESSKLSPSSLRRERSRSSRVVWAAQDPITAKLATVGVWNAG